MRYGYVCAAVLGLAAAAVGQSRPTGAGLTTPKLESDLPMTVYVIREPWHRTERIGRTPGARPVQLPAAGEWGIEIFGDDFARAREAYRKLLSDLAARAGLKAVILSGGGDADLEALAGVEGLVSIWVFDASVTDKSLAVLAGKRGLRDVSFSGCPDLTAAGVTSLAALPELSRLQLVRCGLVSNELVERLSGFPALRRLILSGEATDAGCLPALAKMTKIEQLELSHWRWLTDAHMASIARMTGLGELWLSGCDELRGPGLAALAALPNLRAFGVVPGEAVAGKTTPLGDAWLAGVGKLVSLRKLRLTGCQNLTNPGLANLKALRNLRDVRIEDLRGTTNKVTAEGLAFLADLGELTCLEIAGEGISVTDDWLEKLSRRRTLRSVTLPGSEKVSDAGLARLTALSELRELNLGYCREAGDPGAGGLGKLARLRKFSLGGEKMTAACLDGLAGLREVEVLDIRVNAPGAGVGKLAGLPRLRSLLLNSPAPFTAEALAALTPAPALTDLGIYDWSADTDAGKVPDMPGLQYPALFRFVRMSKVPDMPGLQSFTVEAGSSGKVKDDLFEWASRQRNLQEFNVTGPMLVSEKGLAGPGRLPNLRNLYLAGGSLDVGALCRGFPPGHPLRSLTVSSDGGNPPGSLKAVNRLPSLTTLWLSSNIVADEEDVKAICTLRNMARLSLQIAPSVQANTLMALGGLERMNELNLGVSALNDKVIGVLAGMRYLQILNLSQADGITDAAFAAMARSRRLSALTLYGAGQLTDAALWNLADRKALTRLNLAPAPRISDVGLIHLLGLNLESLRLAGAEGLTDAGLAALARSGRLISLELIGCPQLTDASLAHMASMPALRELILNQCPRFTTAGLPPLARAPALAFVTFEGCKHVAGKGAAELRAKAPHLILQGADEGPLDGADLSDFGILFPASQPASQPAATQPGL